MIGISYVFPLRRPTWRKSANGPREERPRLCKSGLTKRLAKFRLSLLSLFMFLYRLHNTSQKQWLRSQCAHDDLDDPVGAAERRRLRFLLCKHVAQQDR